MQMAGCIVFFVGCVIMAGCASTGGVHPAAEWQTTRCMHERIDAVKAQGKIPQLATVMHKSNQTGIGRELGVPVDLFAPGPAALYLKVVNGLDAAMVVQSGRHALTEYNDLLAGNEVEGIKPISHEQILARWRSDDIEALEKIAPEKKHLFKRKSEVVKEYRRYLENNDPDTLIPMIEEILKRAFEERRELCSLIVSINSKGKTLISKASSDPIGATIAVKEAMYDGSVLSAQLKDVVTGGSYWLDLTRIDSAAKKDLEVFDRIIE